MKSWRIVVVLLLCLTLVGSIACSPFGGDSQEETSQRFVEVMRGDLTVSVSGSGSIDVSNEARLVFGTGGRIDQIFVNEGGKVTEGQVLARLDTASLELALTQAQLTWAQAQLSRGQLQITQAQAQAAWIQAQLALDDAKDFLEDAEDLLEDAEDFLDFLNDLLAEESEKVKQAKLHVEEAESQVEAAQLQLEAAQLQLEAAELQLEAIEPQLAVAELQLKVAEQALGEAQQQLDRATIAAPFNGVVVSVDVDEGDTVSTATRIIHLIDLSSMELQAEVDEIDIATVKPGQRVVISVDAFPDFLLEGEVNSISLMPTVEAGLVAYDVTISFNVPQDSGLRIGMSATADIIIDERSNILLVPDRAIKQDNQGNPVVKVMVDEQIQQKQVAIGISDGFQTEIVSGLDEGETVVIEIKPSTESSNSGGLPFGN